MPDFTAPEYASYVALMRDLRLEREWREGDWIGSSQGWTAPMVWTSERKLVRPNDRYVWLLTGDDWDEMLEAAGVRTTYLEPLPPDEDHPTETWGCVGHAEVGIGLTRIEAKARLWCALTGRTPGA